MPETQTGDQAVEQLNHLLHDSKTLQLATQGESSPEASYSPFVLSDNQLYIFVSQLASHTVNLMRSPAVGVMLIEDEAVSRNLFARNRVSLQCQASEVDRNTPEYDAVMELYRERHGPTVELLSTLPDFILFRLTPEQGRLVLGFGKAFSIQMPGFQLQPVTAETLRR
ncbi:HugZ family pyridoxamine 5'-phosphate oxidase [Amphritea pacifica]|uniref:Pyridoxamine 5'-phosphate oxidase family protein n=1 Tax=Amphritea pacifica TaxID=2811233 RepID=A0ABS2WAS2_9GAMM|nr:pyridoxamine 5'-phosphate oxidase family protein [Amphritea pacifica]MBN0988587.1 pyridoxamine 5'-phosphate oxidase family protein [Amphritea pacifica]